LGHRVQLRHLTTLRLGGTPVRYFRPLTERELRDALEQCARADLAWRVLGGGSNLLVDDGDLPYAVIHMRTPGFCHVLRTGELSVRAGAGAGTARLLAYCKEQGLGGLEFLAGIPGTVGGALADNAGAWGHCISERLLRLTVMTPEGRRREYAPSELAFSYRRTDLDGAVVMEGEFLLAPREPQHIEQRMARHFRDRTERHPVHEPSAGCIFKNAPGHSAGRLLDLCGLKGLRVGGAEVSKLHANFILNRGGATAADVLRLIETMKETVRRQFGVELEMEVRRWPGPAMAA